MFGELILEMLLTIFLPSAVQQHLRSTPPYLTDSRAKHKKAPPHRTLLQGESRGSLLSYLASCGVTLSFPAVDSHFLGWALVLECAQEGKQDSSHQGPLADTGRQHIPEQVPWTELCPPNSHVGRPNPQYEYM